MASGFRNVSSRQRLAIFTTARRTDSVCSASGTSRPAADSRSSSSANRSGSASRGPPRANRTSPPSGCSSTTAVTRRAEKVGDPFRRRGRILICARLIDNRRIDGFPQLVAFDGWIARQCDEGSQRRALHPRFQDVPVETQGGGPPGGLARGLPQVEPFWSERHPRLGLTGRHHAVAGGNDHKVVRSDIHRPSDVVRTPPAGPPEHRAHRLSMSLRIGTSYSFDVLNVSTSSSPSDRAASDGVETGTRKEPRRWPEGHNATVSAHVSGCASSKSERQTTLASGTPRPIP